MMKQVPFYLYDAFSEHRYGGSQAAILMQAGTINSESRVRIARELGYPATVFVSRIENHTITVQFFSTVAELPMCGHGTIGLINCLVDSNAMIWDKHSALDVTLDLAAGPATVKLGVRDDGRALTMLNIRVAEFRDDQIDLDRLCELLSLSKQALSTELPVETAVGDFIHLVVPLQGLAAMNKIIPDFDGMVKFCHQYGIQTITACSTEVVNPAASVHIRDFCPAVGVPESAAAGTTNAAIAGYLFRHRIINADETGQINLMAEQGIVLGRPSEIFSRLFIENGNIHEQWVGGVATRVVSGTLDLPVTDSVVCSNLKLTQGVV